VAYWTEKKVIQRLVEVLGSRAWCEKVREDDTIVCRAGVLDTREFPPVPGVFWTARSWDKLMGRFEGDEFNQARAKAHGKSKDNPNPLG